MSGLQQFLAFAQTARRGSFAAAARDLGQAPSTLAKSVGRLEAELGVKLFHRTTRQVSLTPDGERLYRRCERVLAEVEDLQAEAAGTRAAPSGVIRIDAPITYGRRILMPLLAGLMHRHPQLQLDLRLQDAHADLVREGLDVAIRIGALQDSRLVARRFDWQRLVCVASPAYLAARGTPQRIEDLAGHDIVGFRMPSSGRTRPWQLRSGAPCAGERRRRHGRCRVRRAGADPDPRLHGDGRAGGGHTGGGDGGQAAAADADQRGAAVVAAGAAPGAAAAGRAAGAARALKWLRRMPAEAGGPSAAGRKWRFTDALRLTSGGRLRPFAEVARRAH